MPVRGRNELGAIWYPPRPVSPTTTRTGELRVHPNLINDDQHRLLVVLGVPEFSVGDVDGEPVHRAAFNLNVELLGPLARGKVPSFTRADVVNVVAQHVLIVPLDLVD